MIMITKPSEEQEPAADQPLAITGAGVNSQIKKMDRRPPEKLPLLHGDDPKTMGETQKEDKLQRQHSNKSEVLGDDTICSQAPPKESSKQPAREKVGQEEDSTSCCWILSEVPEQQSKAPPVQQKVLQKKDDTHVLRLLLHQRDLEIQGLKRAAQKEPSARLSFILQELVSMRRRVSETATRYQMKRHQQEHLQNEIDRLNSELQAEKELHLKEIQLLKERLFKSELLVQQLYKEIERLKSQPGRPAHGFTEPQETEVSLKQSEESYKEIESFELWSEIRINTMEAEASNMALRRIPKHTSFLDSIFKDGNPGIFEMDNGSTQISELVQAQFNFYSIPSLESEDRWKMNDFSNFTSSQELASLPVRKERKLHSESSSWDVISSPKSSFACVPSKSEVTLLSPSLPCTEKIQHKDSGSQDLKTDQSQNLCQLTQAGLSGIGVCKTSAMLSDLSKGEAFERAPWDTGFLKIITVNRKGKFVRILNTSLDQEVDLSGFIIQQWIGGYPVSIYRFPLGTTLPALHHVTVWAAGDDLSRKKTTNMTLRAQQYFRTGPECTTVLSNAKGQTLSRYAAPHRLTAAADAYTDDTDLSVDKFPLSGDGEEAAEPLAQKDQPSVSTIPHRGSTGRPLGTLQQTRDRKHFPVGSLNSKSQGDPSNGSKRKIKPSKRESVHKMVSFSSQNLAPLSVKERSSSSFSEEEEEEEDFAPRERQPPTAEPKPRSLLLTASPLKQQPEKKRHSGLQDNTGYHNSYSGSDRTEECSS